MAGLSAFQGPQYLLDWAKSALTEAMVLNRAFINEEQLSGEVRN
jgi:hypothetical protein